MGPGHQTTVTRKRHRTVADSLIRRGKGVKTDHADFRPRDLILGDYVRMVAEMVALPFVIAAAVLVALKIGLHLYDRVVG